MSTHRTATADTRTRPRRDRSKAPTKRARRRENWGTGNPVPATTDRRWFGPEHLAPSSPHADRSSRWLGAHGGPPPRKRTAAWRRKRARQLARTGWRAFYARRGAYRPTPADDGEVGR